MICCDNCTKVFHSNCHKPKIYSVPDGRWTCRYCTVKPVREKKSYKPKYGELLIADMGHKEMSVKVNWPVLNCNVCAEKDSEFIFHDCVKLCGMTSYLTYIFSIISFRAQNQPRLDNLPCLWGFLPFEMPRSTVGETSRQLEMHNMQREE